MAALSPAPAGLDEFLRDYPGMAPRPVAGNGGRVLRGRFAFAGSRPGLPEIEDAYELAITVPGDFPASLPTVVETGGRIPRHADYHVNQHDFTLCLGSPLGLMLRLAQEPTLPGWAGRCLVPYLYAISHKLRHGGALPFGELAHGAEGVLADYQTLFAVRGEEAVFATLGLLGKKKRLANKRPCPCGCRRRVGRCEFNARMREFRRIAGRKWYREDAAGLHLQWAAARTRRATGG